MNENREIAIAAIGKAVSGLKSSLDVLADMAIADLRDSDTAEMMMDNVFKYAAALLKISRAIDETN